MIYLPSDMQVLQHYIQFWGEPKRVLEAPEPYPTPPGPVSVAEFSLGIEEKVCWTYTTIGASRFPVFYPAGEPDLRFELLAYSYQQQDELIDKLRTLAYYPFEKQTYLGIGHRIAGTEGIGIIEGSPLEDILLVPAVNETHEFRVLHLDRELHVNILWVVPIYQSERLYANEQGWRKLVELFVERGMDSADFQLLPVV